VGTGTIDGPRLRRSEGQSGQAGALLIDLRRHGLRRLFRHQFHLAAARTREAPRGSYRQKQRSERWRRWKLSCGRKLGLSAAKHAQHLAARREVGQSFQAAGVTALRKELRLQQLGAAITLSHRPRLGPAKHAVTRRPVRSARGMCEAQRIDLAAASAGRITWAQYFMKWGPGG